MGFFDRFTKKKPGDIVQKDQPLPKKVEQTVSAQKEAKPAKKGDLAKEHGGDSYRIIMKPLFTEKSAMLETGGKYTFLVAPKANKNAVARAISDLYGVKPMSVRIVVSKGKAVRFGRSMGREKNQKKAIITLAKGQTISLVEGA